MNMHTASGMNTEAKADLSPLAQTLADAADDFVLELANSSDELLNALVRADGDSNESARMLSKVR